MSDEVSRAGRTIIKDILIVLVNFKFCIYLWGNIRIKKNIMNSTLVSSFLFIYLFFSFLNLKKYHIFIASQQK